MNPTRFDTISRIFGQRRLQARTRSQRLAQAASPVVATPVPDEVTDPAFMFVQSFEQGTLTPKAASTSATPEANPAPYTLTLANGLGETIFFSDRPERIVGTVATPRFLDALGFTPDNPPNAAVVADRGDGTQDILVIELTAPVYDDQAKSLTYDVRILDDIERVDMQLPQEVATPPDTETTYGSTHLFIDDCDDGYIRCFNDMVQTKTLGDIAVHRCWVWSELCCFPCSTGNDFGKMAAICHDVYGDQCSSGGCSAGSLGACA